MRDGVPTAADLGQRFIEQEPLLFAGYSFVLSDVPEMAMGIDNRTLWYDFPS
jgi:hypothetical protein